MTERCDIAELLPGGSDACPVCTTTPGTRIVLDTWDERRAGATVSEPELLVLSIPG